MKRHSEVWDGNGDKMTDPFRFLTYEPQEIAQVKEIEFDQLIVDYVNSIQIIK